MDALQDEVDSLEAILMDDVRIFKNQSGVPEIIETTVFPMLGEETEQQYVCVTLQVLPAAGYPDVSPAFKLVRPRGLDDARLEEIRGACMQKLQQSLGFPVVFDLIEVVREHLVGSNLPSGQCVVCLFGFSDGDEFTRTECFHYLHSYCLGRHLNAARRNYQEEHDKLPAWQQKTAAAFQAACPVCREPIKDDYDSLRCAMPPAEYLSAPDFKLTRELIELQQRMSSLFLQQKSRGGIIDVDADNAAVISIETEEDMRRRRNQRKREDAAENVNAGGENYRENGDAPGSSASGNSGSESPETGTGASVGVLKLEPKPSGSNSFAPAPVPVVQVQQRVANDASNNSYQQQQHNRRHYRGGRRHQHQHHHQRDRERERERYEHNHHPAGQPAGGAASASASAVANASGKQSKAPTAGGTHTR